MDLLEARRLSAEFCGVGVIELPDFPGWWIDGDNETEWTPDTNAEQMAECMDKLLEREGVLIFGDDSAGEIHEWSRGTGKNLEGFATICPWRHFPMYAAAELMKRSKS